MRRLHKYMRVYIIITVTLLLSGCAMSKSVVADGQNVNTDLSRFKYILVLDNLNTKYVSVNDQLYKAFSDAGFIPVNLMDLAEMDTVDKLSVLICSYNFYLNPYGGNDFLNIHITLQSGQLGTSTFKDEIKLEATANSYGEDTMYSNLTQTLKEIYHGYDESVKRSYLQTSYQRITSNPYRYLEKSLEEVETYLDENRSELDQIEGIWTPFKYDSDSYVDRVRIGIFRCDSPSYDFYATIMDGNLVWLNGEIRLKIRKTSNSNIYSFTMFTDDRMEVSSNAIVTAEGILKLNIDSKYLKSNVSAYVKDYPTGTNTDHSSSLSISTGTGFLLSPAGYVITCQHVVEGAKSIHVIDNNSTKTRLLASVAVSDVNNDLCILQVNGLSFGHGSSLPYGFDDTLNKTGETVFCMGYPLTQVMGNEIKVTNGIISSVTGYHGDVSSYQFCAPAQPGNSGGPLYNSYGNVIGVVNAKISQAENVSYAVKTSYLNNLIGLLSDDVSISKVNQSSSTLSSMVEKFKSAVYIIEVEY